MITLDAVSICNRLSPCGCCTPIMPITRSKMLPRTLSMQEQLREEVTGRWSKRRRHE